MSLSRKRALWLAAESTYGADPSADGSGYVSVPALELGDLADNKEVLDTEYATARQFPTAPLSGRDGWSVTVDVPLIGLGTAAGDGTSPPSNDWMDLILTHIFGTQTAIDGEGLSAVGSSTAVTVDANANWAVQQLLAVHEASVPSAAAERTQWGLATVLATLDYTIAPAFATTPSAAAIAYGSNHYTIADAGGASLALVYQDDDVGTYELLGGRVTSASISGEVGQIMRMSLTIEGDTKTEDLSGKSALPDSLAAPAITPIKTMLSPVFFNGTQYCGRSINIDFGISAAERMSTCAAQGRAEWQAVSMSPVVTIEPLRTDAINDLKRALTKGRLLVQLGAGALSGGVLNTIAIHAEEAVASEVSFSDDNGLARSSIQFKVTDAVTFASTVDATFFQLARA